MALTFGIVFLKINAYIPTSLIKDILIKILIIIIKKSNKYWINK